VDKMREKRLRWFGHVMDEVRGNKSSESGHENEH